jgi:hypothetical protein
MAANKRSAGGRGAGSAVARELYQLGKKVKELTLNLEREAKARKLDARGKMMPIRNADPDCRWQRSHWQSPMVAGSPSYRYRTAPQRQ